MLDRSGLLTYSGLPRPTSLREQITARLRQDILSCQLLPGTILSESQISERYEVKKAPVRAALISEERGGLVHALPRHGWQISPITPRSISNVFTLRHALEPVLVEADLSRADRGQLEMALRMAQSLDGAKDAAAVQTGWRLDRDTLAIIAETLGNALLAVTLSDLWDRTERCMNFAVCKGARPYVASTRADLVRAIEQGDNEGAKRAITSALDRQYAYLTRVVMGMTGEIAVFDQENAVRRGRPADAATIEKSQELRGRDE